MQCFFHLLYFYNLFSSETWVLVFYKFPIPY